MNDATPGLVRLTPAPPVGLAPGKVAARSPDQPQRTPFGSSLRECGHVTNERVTTGEFCERPTEIAPRSDAGAEFTWLLPCSPKGNADIRVRQYQSLASDARSRRSARG